jgi:hypothetical protein
MVLSIPSINWFLTVNAGARGMVPRPRAEAERLWHQAIRARWRALFVVVKAKLVAVDSGITTIEREFLADLVLPDGETVGEWLKPQIEEIYATRTLPKLLPGPERASLTGGRQ